MGANASSLETNDGFNYLPFKSKLDDIPEACVALVLSYLDPIEICKLTHINRVFRAASSADFIWEPKFPSNYKYILQELLGLKVAVLDKKDLFAKLSRPRPFDGGTKEVWIDKKNGGVCLAISSKGMTITAIDDRSYWNHIPTDESRICLHFLLSSNAGFGECIMYADHTSTLGSVPHQAILNEEEREDLLKYWRGNEKTFPTISMMARDVLNIQASSTASESDFSVGRYQIGYHKHSLAGDSLEIVVLFRDWIRAEKVRSIGDQRRRRRKLQRNLIRRWWKRRGLI